MFASPVDECLMERGIVDQAGRPSKKREKKKKKKMKGIENDAIDWKSFGIMFCIKAYAAF